MAKVSARTWTTPAGEKRRAWVLTYQDADGQRHRKQFARKGDADAERVRVEGQLAGGIHVPDSASLTVHDAARRFLADFQGLVTAGKRERSTMDAYETQIDLHLKPYAIAKRKLSRLTGPDCQSYARSLEADVSDAMAIRVFALLRQILRFAQASGWIATAPADAVAIRTGGERAGGEPVVIPPKDHLRALWAAAAQTDDDGRAAAMVAVLMFAGLRASELRGLRRRDLFLTDGKIKVCQRADKWQIIGPVKTGNGRRTVTVPPATIEALRHWLKSAPSSEQGLVFPTGAGTVESYANIYNRLWAPLMTRAGLVEWGEDEAGKEPKPRPLFGLHALRHVACSLWIEQGATPKQVTTWAGHASIQFTMDAYGHLWSDAEADQAIASAAQRSVIG